MARVIAATVPTQIKRAMKMRHKRFVFVIYEWIQEIVIFLGEQCTRFIRAAGREIKKRPKKGALCSVTFSCISLPSRVLHYMRVCEMNFSAARGEKLIYIAVLGAMRSAARFQSPA
jgi:hypothetical protein